LPCTTNFGTVVTEAGVKGATPYYIRSPVVGHWLVVSALTVLVGWWERHPACKQSMPLISRYSFPEQVEEENQVAG